MRAHTMRTETQNFMGGTLKNPSLVHLRAASVFKHREHASPLPRLWQRGWVLQPVSQIDGPKVEQYCLERREGGENWG